VVAGYSHGALQRHNGWITAALLLAAACFPLLDAGLGLGLQVSATAVVVLALVALGLNVLIGYVGILDLGFAACFALGAYTTGMLTNVGSIFAPFLPRTIDAGVLLLASAGVAAVFGLLNGALTTRLGGETLAIATLALGQMVPRTFVNLDAYTSGARGLAALPPPTLFGMTLQSQSARYLLALTVLALAAFISLRLRASRFGRAWGAVSEDATAAASVGVNVTRARLGAFVLSAAFAGAAGALFAMIFSYVDPETSDVRISAMVLAMVAIGGAGSVPGVILGAVLVVGYDQIVIPALGAAAAAARINAPDSLLALLDVRDLSYLSFGLALYLTIWLRARPGLLRAAWLALPGSARRKPQPHKR
jgi:branched-chain amino acid transport system permease protein